MTRHEYDFVIIGAGIAGASLGYFLAPHARVLILEREAHPGYHSTGRSAAAFVESYGPPQVRALTRASRAFLSDPPPGFTEHPILTTRPTMLVASPGQEPQLAQLFNELHALNDQVRLIDAHEACALVPALVPERVIGAVLEPDSSDIDVDALHQGYLRGFRRSGGTLRCDARIEAITRSPTAWQLRLSQGSVTATTLIDAAGAWADEVARLAGVAPLGFQPRRRSAFVFRPSEDLDCARWPLTIGIDEDWYLKPEAGLLLGSPANADDCPAHDVQAEEFDIALAIDRIEAMTTLRIRRPERTWAGLRTFSPDGSLVGGFDVAEPGFFWLAGQGGYGIQTSAAMGLGCAALVRGLALPASLLDQGLTDTALGPARLQSDGPSA